MTNQTSIYLENERATDSLAHEFISSLTQGMLIFLEGDLGAGKTCFVRSALRALGHEGAVKSPTFTLVETYDTSQYQVIHSDLYRLAEPEELEYIGFRDYLNPNALVFVEWPSKGAGYLSEPDLLIKLSVEGVGRRIVFNGKSPLGHQFLEQWK